MDLLSIILLAIGLAMDCFAVSFSKGIASGKQPQWKNLFLMAFFFGLYQGGMPLIGFYAGVSFSDFFTRWSHWIAFCLLGFIGGKMIFESLKNKTTEEQRDSDKPLVGLLEIQILALATSIDALASGLLFIPVPETLWLGISIIALASFIFSLCGYFFGYKFGAHFRLNAEFIGGIILIGIGLKILIEHLLR